MSGVTKARPLHVIVSHLDHQLGAERLPRRTSSLGSNGSWPLAGARPLFRLRPRSPTGALEAQFLRVRGQEGDQLSGASWAKPRRHPDVLQFARIIEEPEQQRSNNGAFACSCPPESGNHASQSRSCLTLIMVRLLGS